MEGLIEWGRIPIVKYRKDRGFDVTKPTDSHHVHYVVVSGLADVELVLVNPPEDVPPLLLIDEGGGVHRAAVADHKAVLA